MQSRLPSSSAEMGSYIRAHRFTRPVSLVAPSLVGRQLRILLWRTFSFGTSSRHIPGLKWASLPSATSFIQISISENWKTSDLFKIQAFHPKDMGGEGQNCQDLFERAIALYYLKAQSEHLGVHLKAEDFLCLSLWAFQPLPGRCRSRVIGDPTSDHFRRLHSTFADTSHW